MRHAWLWVGLLWLAVLFATSFDDEPPPQALAQLVREALDHNPEIQAARQRWESARAVVPQVQTLPDPKVNFVYWGLEQQAMYGMTQEIPFPGKLGLKGEIASRESERVEQNHLATRLAVVARLKEAFYELHMIHKSIEVISKNKLLLEDFEETAEARYAVGQAAQQDVFRAQTEISRLLARLASLEQRRQSSHAEINRLLNRLPSDPLGAPEDKSAGSGFAREAPEGDRQGKPGLKSGSPPNAARWHN